MPGLFPVPRVSERRLREWWPLVIGLALVIMAGLLAARVATLNRLHNERVAHALEILAESERLLVLVTHATSTQRGRALTGAPEFAQAHAETIGQIEPSMERLMSLTRDNAAQQARLLEIRGLLRARLREMRLTDDQLDAGDFEGARRRVLLARDQMNELRAALAAFKAAETELLMRRRERADRSAERLVGLIAAGLGLAALLVAGAIRALRARADALAQVNEEVRALNQGLEDRVAERTARLAEANEEIQRFAYIVSHDLRSPLVNVMGFTAELEAAQAEAAGLLAAARRDAPALATPARSEAIERDMPEAIGFIRAATQRMDRLIKAILRMSRDGRRPLQPEPLALGEVAGALAQGLRSQADAVGGRIEVGPLPAIVSDRLAVEQMLGNLLENALKYGRPGVPPEVRVSGERIGAAVRLRVADNGRGVAPEDRERIFELFRRAGRQDQPGEGIGLATVRSLARRLGGTIAIEDAPGGGSVFTLTLPAALPAERA